MTDTVQAQAMQARGDGARAGQSGTNEVYLALQRGGISADCDVAVPLMHLQ